MTFHFDLINEPWIPVVSHSAADARELSLRSVLQNAHTVRELGGTPVVTVGILRLLLACLYRIGASNGRSLTQDDWLRLRDAGSFPEPTIDRYLNQWAPRFDLFDSEYPFYQTADLDMDSPKSLSGLTPEFVSGNNPTLFDHSTDAAMKPCTPAESARLLVGAQSFALAGLLRAKSRLARRDLYHASAFNGSVPPGAAIWLSGENLFETLLLNLAPQENDKQDAPCWELDPPWKYRDPDSGTKHLAKGAMDRFTWQSRLVRLLPEMVDGVVMVRGCYLTQGRSSDPFPDPMHSYYASEKKGKMIVRLSDRKATWRDAHAIFDRTDGAEKPAAFNSVSTLILDGEVSRTQLYLVNVAGIANDQAKVLLWRHDRMSVPAELLADETLEQQLTLWMRWADYSEWKLGGKMQRGMAKKIRDATKSVVSLYLAPGDRQTDPADVTRLTEALDPMGLYWSRLEGHFQRLLLDLRECIDAPDRKDLAANTWAAAIEKEARQAFEQAVRRGLGRSSRAIQALARVGAFFKVDKDEPQRATTEPANLQKK